MEGRCKLRGLSHSAFAGLHAMTAFSSILLPGRSARDPTTFELVLSGTCAGLVQVTRYPFETVKSRMVLRTRLASSTPH